MAYIDLYIESEKHYKIVCNVFDVITSYSIMFNGAKKQALQDYNSIKQDIAKIVDIYLCCFNVKIARFYLLDDCSHFIHKWN